MLYLRQATALERDSAAGGLIAALSRADCLLFVIYPVAHWFEWSVAVPPLSHLAALAYSALGAPERSWHRTELCWQDQQINRATAVVIVIVLKL